MSATDARIKLEKAYDLIHRLAQGKERWTMQVPARPDKDSDLVLADACDAGLALADRVDKLEDTLRQIAEYAEVHPPSVTAALAREVLAPSETSA